MAGSTAADGGGDARGAPRGPAIALTGAGHRDARDRRTDRERYLSAQAGSFSASAPHVPSRRADPERSARLPARGRYPRTARPRVVRPLRVRARLAPRERTTRFQAFVEHPKTRGSSSLRPTRQKWSRVPRILQSHWASETSRRARGCGDVRVDGMYNVALYMRAPTVVASRPVRGRASERCARATGAVPTAERARGPRSTRAGSGRAVTRRASSPRGGAFRYSLFALICRAARARPPTDVGASRRRGVTCLPVSGYSMNTSRSQRALRALQSASESFRDFKSGSPRSRS
jgi:hypothetical protein